MLSVFYVTIIILQITRDVEYIRNYKTTCALRKKTINSLAPLISNVQYEPNLAIYSYTQAVKTPFLQDITNKYSNTKYCIRTAIKQSLGIKEYD